MQSEHIETFLDLVETRSFNRTAERLGVTQSTVSARVAALEKRLGKKLFARSRAGTDLTIAGRSFEPHARDLRHAWTEAVRGLEGVGNAALSMRIGLQIDLADSRIGAWVTRFRALLPGTAIYVELDYSNQMCRDLLDGKLNLAVLYSPHAVPDIHFESVGEVRYRLVSSESPDRADLSVERYIRGGFSATFEKHHNRLFPEFARSPLACGHSAAMVRLLATLGGSGFVLEEDVPDLIGAHGFHVVEDIEPIPQTIYMAIHVRHRHDHAARRLFPIVRDHLGG